MRLAEPDDASAPIIASDSRPPIESTTSPTSVEPATMSPLATSAPSTSPSSSAAMEATLELRFKPTVSAFISAVMTASPDEETAVFGTRGDGKTTGALGAMIAHAQQHHALGYPLPTKWLGAADTFQSHVAKTH